MASVEKQVKKLVLDINLNLQRLEKHVGGDYYFDLDSLMQSLNILRKLVNKLKKKC